MTIHFKNGKYVKVSFEVVEAIRKRACQEGGAAMIQWFFNEKDELFLCINISEISHITD